MRTLVVGTGFIGTNLIKRYWLPGGLVRAVYHTKKPNLDCECVQADLTIMDDCKRVVRGIDQIFMCAASTSGAAVFKSDPLSHVTPNVVMNANLMEAAYKAGVQKFVFISSSAAYPPTDHPVKEEEMFHGDPYPVYYSVGWMKRYVETLCKTYSDLGMTCVVIRPSNIIGPYDKFDFERSHFTAALIRRVAEKHNPIEVWGTGDDARDLIYIDDFLDGLMLVSIKNKHIAVNIASGQTYTVKQVLNTLLTVSGHNAQVHFDPSKPTTIPMRSIDISLARSLGFTPRVSLEDGLNRTLEWYKENLC